MSGLGKGSLSIRKKDLQSQKSIGVSFKILRMWHKATLGDSSINLASLVFPSTELPGASNPTSAEILAAQAYINKNSVSISSSHKPFINRLSYDIASSSTINFNGWTAEDGEIFEITINPAPTTGLRVVDASPIIKTGVLTAGSTQFIVGTAFELNKYPNEQVGAVQVFVDGEIQARNVGNAAASPSANGNYHEDDAGGKVSNSITFNEAFAVDVNVMVISTGLVVSNPSDSRDQAIESLAAQMDVVVADLAEATGNDTTRYQAQPNQVDLAAFGNRVFSAETSITSLLPLLDPTQMSNALATKLGHKTYAHGTTYNGGIAPTVTGSISSVTFSEFIPYQMQNGNWRLKFNIDVSVPSSSRTDYTLTINGVVFKNGTNPSVTSMTNSSVISIVGRANSNAATLTSFHSSATTDNYKFSGDVTLESKPTWAY